MVAAAELRRTFRVDVMVTPQLTLMHRLSSEYVRDSAQIKAESQNPRCFCRHVT
jgi:hypothetical protein